jgi:hypothetical protein
MILKLPAPSVLDTFTQHGFIVLKGAITPDLRKSAREAAERALASDITIGRDRGADGKDGFRGVMSLDDAFLPFITNPAVLGPVVSLMGPNLHLLSSHLVALPSVPVGQIRSIRIPERPGWHRDMFGVEADLGSRNLPMMAIKAAYYLTDPAPNSGVTMFVPGSQIDPGPVAVPAGAIDPPGAVTPEVGPYDTVLFENRTWHAGGLNISGSPRLALMLQYGYRWLAPVDDSTCLLQRGDLTDVQRQLLGARDRRPDGSLAKGTGGRPLADWWHHGLVDSQYNSSILARPPIQES